MRKKLNSKGFTLIELLIVIIIIGILAAIAFVAYSGAQNKAHKASAESTLSEVKAKLAEYNADNSSYPATIGDVDKWLASSTGGNNKTLSTTFTAANGYSYATDPASGCGDTVADDGTVSTAAGNIACTGFSLTVAAADAGGYTIPAVTN